MSDDLTEDRADFADEYRKAERCVYRECEYPCCTHEAEWRSEDDIWLCGDHAT